MKILYSFLALLLVSCSPMENNKDYETKYPDTPTMQSAEDANSGVLFRD